MTITELRDALNLLIEQGHGDKDVVVLDCQWSEGAHGHTSIIHLRANIRKIVRYNPSTQ